MLNITLKDGLIKQFPKGTTLMEVAKGVLSSKLFSKMIAARVLIGDVIPSKLVDLSYVPDADLKVEFINEAEAAGLEIIRHSAAHLLAHAVKELFPQAKITIGPVIEDGFYYDFDLEYRFTEADFDKIENKMREIAKRNLPIKRKLLSRKSALEVFAALNEDYKVELINDLPLDSEITAYEQGDFIDLCRGPHLINTAKLKWFKLVKIAGAYWRGDSNNKMLQRIYGTAWASKAGLDDYLRRIEQAKLRDHRILGKKMDLFHIQEEAPGMVFWHPDGWVIYQEIKKYISERLREFGYQEINTPQLIDRSLWEKSGHWEKYAEVMFITEAEHHIYAVKPMSCPGHIQIFKQGLKSYRDLPIRYAEFGYCHRNESSGTLHGLMRVRGFVQDDGHIFCTEAQIAVEVASCIQQLQAIYRHFGFSAIIMKLATRPEKRIGADEVWDKAEQALTAALNQTGAAWDLSVGEGAFYGPKIEFSLKDSLGRVWQCGTIQVDFSMAVRLDAYYIDENGEKRTPVMLHRAMCGSIERFIGILLEETFGYLPFWLAPVQVMVLNITDSQLDYAKEILEKLQKLGFRANADLRNEKIGYKIRECSIKRVPYCLIVGDKEKNAKLVAVRDSKGKDLGQMVPEDFIKLISID